jgi:hypothetical protein
LEPTREEFDDEQSVACSGGGPLMAFAPGFRADLARQGYRPGSAADQLGLMAHVSRWLAGQGLGAADLTAIRVEQFSGERRAERRSRFVGARDAVALLTARYAQYRRQPPAGPTCSRSTSSAGRAGRASGD